jgi:hypothetical protein
MPIGTGEPPFGPLNPVSSNEELLGGILRYFPDLTREEALEMAEFCGFDLTAPDFNRAKPSE